MSVQYTEQLKSVSGVVKQINISIPKTWENSITLNPNDTSFTTSLPTTQTSTIGMTYTIQQSDFPVITPISTYALYSACAYLGGHNATGSTVTLYWTVYKNGATIASSSYTVSNNWFWALSIYPTAFQNIQVGDIINIQVWASSINMTYDYCACNVYASRIISNKLNQVVKDLTFSNFATPIYTGFQSIDGGSSLGTVYIENPVVYCGTGTNYGMNILTTTTFPIYQQQSTYGIFRGNIGDQAINNGFVSGHSSIRYFQYNRIPQTITYRELYTR